jgi:hypothetical protein
MRNLLLAAAAALPLALLAPASSHADVMITQVGNPTWQPVDIHLFSAPAEPFGTVGFATANAILTPHFFINSSGVIVPIPPDPGPYTNEIANGLSRLGISDQSIFRPDNLAGKPNGIWLAYMLVPRPGSPIGSSPDYASGPIIPEGTFPIVGTEEVLRNGFHFDSSVVTTRALSTLGFNVDGSSHRPQLLETDLPTADNPLGLTADQLPGHYQFDVSLRDAQGNGYDIVVPFDVLVPEPSTLALVALGGGALAGWRKWRKHKLTT